MISMNIVYRKTIYTKASSNIFPSFSLSCKVSTSVNSCSKSTTAIAMSKIKTENCIISEEHLESSQPFNPAYNYMFKINNRNTRKKCEIFSKLTIKTPERRHWRRSGVFIVNFEHTLF